MMQKRPSTGDIQDSVDAHTNEKMKNEGTWLIVVVRIV